MLFIFEIILFKFFDQRLTLFEHVLTAHTFAYVLLSTQDHLLCR
jgi:hypothetical protein